MYFLQFITERNYRFVILFYFSNGNKIVTKKTQSIKIKIQSISTAKKVDIHFIENKIRLVIKTKYV